MKIIYLLSSILLLIEIIVIKKTNKKQNIIVSIIYSLCTFYFYNLLLSIILSALNITNDLFSFSISYLITFSIIYFYYKKNHNTFSLQKYFFNKKELIILIIIIILCLCIGIYRYSLSFNTINYEIGDSAIHYKMSLEYSHYSKLFDNNNISSIVNYKNSMFGYYVPCGLFMKLLTNPITSYNIFNTVLLCLISLCFYATLLTIKKSKKHNIITIATVIMYTLAYPLNYMLFGFGYLGPGILATNLIILTFNHIKKEDIKIWFILLNLFNLGLFCSYYLFVPIVFLSELLYLIYLYKNNKNKLIKIILFCLIIPSIFGYIYFIKPANIISLTEAYGIEGESYQDLLGNFILLIPIVCYSILNQAKKNKCDFNLVLSVCLFIYIIGTFLLIGNGYISSYYFYKPYYIFWLVIYVLAYKTINYDKYINIFRIQFAFIIIINFFAVYNIEKIVSEKDRWFEYSGIFERLGNIYDYNKEKIKKPRINISKDNLKLITSPQKYAKKCKLTNKKYTLPYISDSHKKWWYYAINDTFKSDKYDSYLINDNYLDDSNYEEYLKHDDIKCIVVEDKYKKLIEHNIENDYEILYKNKIGKLYKKK